MSGVRYTFERQIGRGASGPVWAGRDTVLGRQVALKRVGTQPGEPSGPLGPDGAREARLAASLSHPHVVDVLDLAVIDGEHWLVMEYVEGTDLSEVVRSEGPMAPVRAAGLLAQVAEALDAAHRAGIVHRDVKPSNVLVDAEDCAKLTDFGIARSAEDDALTATGLVTGSPAYLAPEVATGRSASPASDVWSLGATLFHLLAGRPPYHVGDNVLSTMYRIVHEEPPRLPEFGPLDQVLQRTMAVDPQQRWTMWQVHEALLHYAEHEAHEAGLPRPVVRGIPAYVGGHGTTSTRSTPAVPLAYAAAGRRHVRTGAWLLGAAATVVVTILAFQLGRGGEDQAELTAAGPGVTSDAPPVTEASSQESAKRAMREFVTSYLAEVTTDRRSAWQRLTPEFQKASNGFGSYSGFWRTVESATPRDVVADPATMTVTYEVDYVMTDGRRLTDRVTLQLSGSGSSLRIAGET